MGIDIHVHIVKTYLNKSELVGLYNKNGKYLPPYDLRCPTFFDVISEISGRPVYVDFLPEDLRKECNPGEMGTYGYKELNLADLKLEYINNSDLNEEEKNAFSFFMNKIETYIDIFENSCPLPASYYKLIIWFDH